MNQTERLIMKRFPVPTRPLWPVLSFVSYIELQCLPPYSFIDLPKGVSWAQFPMPSLSEVNRPERRRFVPSASCFECGICVSSCLNIRSCFTPLYFSISNIHSIFRLFFEYLISNNHPVRNESERRHCACVNAHFPNYPFCVQNWEEAIPTFTGDIFSTVAVVKHTFRSQKSTERFYGSHIQVVIRST